MGRQGRRRYGQCAYPDDRARTQSAFPGAALYFPPGIYNFASSVSFAYPPGSTPFSLTLQGAGADVTILNWTAQDGLVFAMSQPSHTVHMRDMSITCTSVGLSTGIRITQSATQLSPQMQNDFSNVTFRGFRRRQLYELLGDHRQYHHAK